MPSWKSHFIEVNGITLHYYRSGGAKPPLVLVHGITDNALCWTRLAHQLESDYDLILLDARGHGLSDKPSVGYTNSTLAEDVASVIDLLDLKKPALLGHSMGAATIAFMAAQYPELPGCLLLEDPPWRERNTISTQAERDAFAADWEKDLQKQKLMSPAELLHFVANQHPTWSAKDCEDWVPAKQQVSPKVLEYVRVGTTPWWVYIERISCPTLLLTADTTAGGIVSMQTAAQVVAANPQVTVQHIAHAGHSIRREQFEVYTQTARAFLAAVSNRSRIN
jgi:pimeloyl-ACP methyl ester carboxylesterase